MCEQEKAKQVEHNMSYKDIASQQECEWPLQQLIREVQGLKHAIEFWMEREESPKISLEDSLWTVTEVADYLHKSKGTIQSHYQNKPGFPKSKKIGATRYWKPREIMAYAKRVPG